METTKFIKMLSDKERIELAKSLINIPYKTVRFHDAYIGGISILCGATTHYAVRALLDEKTPNQKLITITMNDFEASIVDLSDFQGKYTGNKNANRIIYDYMYKRFSTKYIDRVLAYERFKDRQERIEKFDKRYENKKGANVKNNFKGREK